MIAHSDYTETQESLTLLKILASTKAHPDAPFKSSPQFKRIKRIEEVLRKRKVIK